MKYITLFLVLIAISFQVFSQIQVIATPTKPMQNADIYEFDTTLNYLIYTESVGSSVSVYIQDLETNKRRFLITINDHKDLLYVSESRKSIFINQFENIIEVSLQDRTIVGQYPQPQYNLNKINDKGKSEPHYGYTIWVSKSGNKIYNSVIINVNESEEARLYSINIDSANNWVLEKKQSTQCGCGWCLCSSMYDNFNIEPRRQLRTIIDLESSALPKSPIISPWINTSKIERPFVLTINHQFSLLTNMSFGDSPVLGGRTYLLDNKNKTQSRVNRANDQINIFTKDNSLIILNEYTNDDLLIISLDTGKYIYENTKAKNVTPLFQKMHAYTQINQIITEDKNEKLEVYIELENKRGERILYTNLSYPSPLKEPKIFSYQKGREGKVLAKPLDKKLKIVYLNSEYDPDNETCISEIYSIYINKNFEEAKDLPTILSNSIINLDEDTARKYFDTKKHILRSWKLKEGYLVNTSYSGDGIIYQLTFFGKNNEHDDNHLIGYCGWG